MWSMRDKYKRSRENGRSRGLFVSDATDSWINRRVHLFDLLTSRCYCSYFVVILLVLLFSRRQIDSFLDMLIS